MGVWFLFVSIIVAVVVSSTGGAIIQQNLVSLSITRHHNGDMFVTEGTHCEKDLCVGLSSGTAGPIDVAECTCKCMPNLPIFRDDLNICVDDIQECTLAPFVSGTTTQKIPFVFLPLKGQIVYPSAEITFSEVSSPICVVSGAQFLARGGWIDLRNGTDTEPPFRLFRDEGRTYLQWLGEGELRNAMEGRLILVHLMCKDASESQQHKILTPCVAFRVAGNPSVREVMFANDVRRTSETSSGGLTVSEYVAIAICSILLGLIYIASVFLFIHIKKRRKNRAKKDVENTSLTVGEEGVIKTNPLLQPGRRHHNKKQGQENEGYSSESGSCCSDSDDMPSELAGPDDDSDQQNIETSVIVHPFEIDTYSSQEPTLNQDTGGIECLPQEDVSIVETLENREDRPETVQAMTGANVRRKLYFNPAYFEPDLLKTPPPAAIEFLTKIREVIAIAKHKMSAKRFSPSLIGIPEEENYNREEITTYGLRSRASSIASHKSGSDVRCTPAARETPKGNYNSVASGACCPSDTKQRIIRKWLEEVPVIKVDKEIDSHPVTPPRLIKESEEKERKLPETPKKVEIKKVSVKGPAPPRPPPPNTARAVRKQLDVDLEPPEANKATFITFRGKSPPEPPPPIPTSNPGPLPSSKGVTLLKPSEDPDSVPRVQGKDKVPPAVARTLMDAVIQELVVQKKIDSKKVPDTKVNSLSKIEDLRTKEDKSEPVSLEFESDSLERTKPLLTTKKIIDSHIDPNPTDDAKTENHEDHDYEVILLNPESNTSETDELKIYNLSEILAKSEGYSLVSEVYVNDGYTYSSGQPSPSGTNESKCSSKETDECSEPESPGRLTIQVKDSPENYKKVSDEEDHFEPDTLDRKPGKMKIVGTITNWEDSIQDKYSNQRFHAMDLECQNKNKKNEYLNNETYTDSLERPHIMLKSNGSFRKATLEQHVDELLRKLDSPLAKDFSSLREIYEMKNKAHRIRTETTSLIGESVTSDTDCQSTHSWSEDRRNKLIHRGIVLHMGGGKGRKHRRSKTKDYLEPVHYPDVVPPRPPKPSSLNVTPQRSNCQTPCSRSVGPSPNRSACTSPPPPPSVYVPLNRSACTSPPRSVCPSPNRSACASPPPPPPPCVSPPPRENPTPPPPPPRLLSPSLLSSHQKSNYPFPPPPPSVRSPSPGRSYSNSRCTSPTSSRITSPSRSVCQSPTQQLSRSLCTSPPPPIPSKVSPPLPPRNLRPPLPPKNAKSTRQKKTSPNGCNFSHRPLPPLPSRHYQDSTISSVSSRDIETLSTLSGASMDSLNSSDYEAFYTLPYEGNEGMIYDKALEKILHFKQGDAIFSTDEDVVNHSKTKNQRRRTAESMKKSWKKIVERKTTPHKPEDSGYLSTDSNESHVKGKFKMGSAIGTKIISERSDTPGSQISESEESVCDGASESGAESTATDSFFFGNSKQIWEMQQNIKGNLSSEGASQKIPIVVRH